MSINTTSKNGSQNLKKRPELRRLPKTVCKAKTQLELTCRVMAATRMTPILIGARNIKDIQLGSRYTRYTTVDESLHQLNILNMVNLPLFTGVLAPSQVVIAGILETNSRYTVQPPPKAIFGSVFYLVEGHSFASIFVIHQGFGRPKWSRMRPARSSVLAFSTRFSAEKVGIRRHLKNLYANYTSFQFWRSGMNARISFYT